MRIALLSEQVRHYSGGRVFCYQIGICLAELGHDVTIYATRGIPFRRDFDLYRQPKIVITSLFSSQDIPKHDLFIGLPMLGASAACQLGTKYQVPSVVCVLDVLPLMRKYRSDNSAAMQDGFWQGMLAQIEHSGSYVFVLADVNRGPAADWTGVPIQKVFTVYPAVNDRVIDSLPEPAQREYRCCFISRLEPHKKLPHAIDAVKPFGFHLDVVTARADNQLINRRDMREYATFHVGVSDEEKFEILLRSRFLIMPSTWEGFGMPIVEALACETSVVCYDFPTFREVVNGSEVEKYVYFARYNDREDLARQVAQCVRQGFSGRFEADRRFGMNRMMMRLAQILQRIEV